MSASRLAHAFHLGWRSLVTHRLRSGLTALGVVLGVGSVIVMLAVGEAARYQALKQLEDLGASTILLRSVKPAEENKAQKGADLLAYGLTYADADRIRESVPTVTQVTPMREFRKTVRFMERKMESRILGVTPEFLTQFRIPLALGRNFTREDNDRYANVCVLGSAAAEKLFPTQNPIGRTVTIEDMSRAKAFTVVGITEQKTLAAGGPDSGETDYNRVVFIPYATDRVRFGRELFTMKAGSFQAERLEVSQVTVTIDDVLNVPRTAVAIQSMIEQFHPSRDVLIVVPLDLLQKAEQTQRLFTLILGAIAGISLLVGGIGIMNIMLATVTERTREIGIRRALGAKRRDIATQFLAETLVLACGGGILGIALGVGLAFGVSSLFGLPTIIRVYSPVLAFFVSLLVGLMSGIYPATRAARLDPIEALRHS